MTTPRLPGWIAPPPSKVNGRLPASEINKLSTSTSARQATAVASGASHRIVYGRARIGGRLFAAGKIGTNWVFGFEWCLGEIQEVESIWINDAAPTGGMTVTHYTGTTSQTPNANLVSAIAGYDDDLIDRTMVDNPIGIAYSVIRIPTGQIDGFPRVQAVIKGRKVYDPRTMTTGYSENPALCLGDLITHPVYGLGRDVIGLDDCADNCDFLVGGTDPRCRIGLAITTPKRTREYMDLLAEYAELYWSEDGEFIRLIPDAPVEEPAETYGTGDYIAGTLRIDSRDLGDAPTVCEVSYIDTTGGGEPWQDVTAPAQLPGVDTGDVPRIPTTLRMEGINRFSEAYRKALRRLRRAAVPNAVRWTTFDYGIIHQIGDVVRIDAPDRGLDITCRIMSVRMSQPGRYEVSADQYSDDLYPEDVVTPGDAVDVPVGLITILRSGDVPSGWELYTAANGRFIVGAGDSYAVGATGGSANLAVSGTTSSDDAHGATNTLRVQRAGSGPVESTFLYNASVAAHSHTYNATPAFTPVYQQYRLIRKTGTTASLLPNNTLALAAGTILNPAIEQVIDGAGRYLRANTAASAGGSSSPVSVAITTSASGAHSHQSGVFLADTAIDFANLTILVGSAPNHQHAFSMNVTTSIKARRMTMYGGAFDYPLLPGMVFMWSGDIGDIPAGFQLCDGTNGTPDMRDHFVRLSDTLLGDAEGDNTQSWSSVTNTVTHTHNTGSVVKNRFTTTTGHGDRPHSHTVSGSAAYMPRFFALAFISSVPE